MTTEEILERLRGDDRRALPRMATLIENGDPRGLAALDLIYPSTGQAHVVGITGPPGSGKSTLVAALLDKIRASDRRVAVLAMDPSSSLTGGAVLGDRIRMIGPHLDDGVYVRSMASRGRQGGLAWASAGLVHLLDAVGFPIILVETVGTGQDGTDISSLAETVVVVEAPGLGDGIQAIKSGLLEVGDVVVVNKADKPGANDALRILRASFELGHSRTGRRVPVMSTVAATGEGVGHLMAEIDAHGQWLNETGERHLRREQAARAEILAGLRTALDRRIDAGPEHSAQLTNLISRVSRRELSPSRAIEAISAGMESIVAPR